MTEKIHITLTIPTLDQQTRLDQALAKLLPDYSRTQIQTWIKNADLTLDGLPTKTRANVKGGEVICIQALAKVQPDWEAQPLDLHIVYEDEAVLVINKPIGLVVHPAAGNLNHTLLNALVHHCPALKQLPRAGIVHRLDKDTSGLLVIAKTPLAVKQLTAQIKAHSMVREYQAIVAGVLISGGTIDAPVGRHPIARKQMKVIDTGRPAVTHYRVIERYRAHTRIKVSLETGRTHQIRVHMAHIHHAVLGDQTYGGRLHIPKNSTPELIHLLRHFKHQALHAFHLGFIHPTTQKYVEWEVPLPEDIKQLITILKADSS